MSRIANEYRQAARELRTTRQSLLTSIDSYREVMNGFTRTYLNDVLFLVEVTMETGRIKKRRSRQTQALHYSVPFRTAQKLINNTCAFLRDERQKTKLQRVRSRKSPQDMTRGEIEAQLLNLRHKIQELKISSKMIAGHFMKVAYEFTEITTFLPVTPLEYSTKFDDFVTAVEKLHSYRARRALATETFPGLQVYRPK